MMMFSCSSHSKKRQTTYFVWLWLVVEHLNTVHGFSPLSFLRTPSHHDTRRLTTLGQHEAANENDVDILAADNTDYSNLAPLYMDQDEDDDEDDDIPCDLLLKYGNYNKATKFIFIISDSTGVTAKAAVEKTLTQFDDNCTNDFKESGKASCIISIRSFTFIKGPAAVAQIVQAAVEKKALVVFTMVDPTLRDYVVETCESNSVPVIDLLGPTLMALSNYLEATPIGIPRGENVQKSKNTLTDLYFRRIQAVEFTLKTDDGQRPWLLREAHVVLVGVSRTGKTPLSVVLSQTMGFKVANVPLVVECMPPQELFQDSIDSQRVFCLTIAPSALRKIRTSRLERMGSAAQDESSHSSNYADRAYLQKDLQHARDLATKHGWTEIDVTGRAVEETASYISELLNERFQDFCL